MAIRSRPAKGEDWYEYGGDLDDAARKADALPTQVAPAVHNHTASQISDSTSVGRAVLRAGDAAAARAALGVIGTGQAVTTLTQAQYDALASKDPNTLYRVTV